MFKYNGYEIALVNTQGLWYALIKDDNGFTYESVGYEDREECKAIAKILTHLEGAQR